MNKTSKIKTGELVLLIDDEDVLRRTYKNMLIELGFKVVDVPDGFTAIEIFGQRKKEIRLVICDLTMPQINGWETLSVLKKLSPDTPLILSSGYFNPDIMKPDCFEGPQAFLSKPFSLKELNETINRVLQKQRESELS
jgi:two-component system, cell cycle sensor histidine kinase and response regulator CckA